MTDLNVKKLQPTAGYILVEPSKQETQTKSGIILAEDNSEKPQTGTVLAVGEGSCACGACGCACEEKTCHCSDDAEGKAPAKVGDQVIYKKWGGNEVKIGDVEYQFLKFEDILAVITK
jgi:chaperonin GroES